MHHTASFTSLKYNGCHQPRHKKSGRRRSSGGIGAETNSSSNGDVAEAAAAVEAERLAGAVDLEQDRLPASHNHLKRYGSIAQLSSVPKTGPYLCTG